MGRFTFEEEMWSTLEYMPFAVRYRLDRAGVKFSLKAWRALPYKTRLALCEHPVDTEHDRAILRTRCLDLAAQTGAPASLIEPAGELPPWRDDAAYGRIVARAGTEVLTRARWQALPDEHAYILWRLANPAKGDARFTEALRELERA